MYQFDVEFWEVEQPSGLSVVQFLSCSEVHQVFVIRKYNSGVSWLLDIVSPFFQGSNDSKELSVVEFIFFSVSVNIFDINATGCQSPFCWIISSMGSLTVRSWLVSTIDSHTIVFVQLLTRLQGASTTLAKHESTFVDYILLGPINSNTNKSQVAPVLKSRFEDLELELSIWCLQSTNQALF